MELQRVPGMRLGRTPKRDDPRNFMLATYLPVLPKAPASLDLTTGIAKWPMYANDQLGDCTCAAAAHMIEVWSEQVDKKAKTFTDNQVIALYNLVNGGQDNGANMLDVLHVWRHAGLARHRVIAFAEVNVANKNLVKVGSWMFSGLYIGVNMPKSSQAQTGPGKVWDAASGPDGKPRSWGGHAVDVVGYDAKGLTVVTWGILQKMTWAFWNKYVEEAYACLPMEYKKLKAKPLANGFKEQELEKDLQNVGPVNP